MTARDFRIQTVAVAPPVEIGPKRRPYEVRTGGLLIYRALTEGEAMRYASRFVHATAEVYRDGELIAECGGRGGAA